MILQLFRFECDYLLRKPGTWAVFVLFLLSGLFMGSLKHLPYPEVHRNAPYFIAYFAGLATLGTIFTSTLMVARSLLKVSETGMDQIVYTAPLSRFSHLFPPLAAVFTLTFFTVTLAILGLLIGNYLPWLPASERGPFSVLSYVWPLVVLAAPNILFCLGITVCIAWVSGNSLSVYIGGLLIFILYLIGSIFSNSPLLAGASPATPEAMALTARLDPFGLAAYFEQTRYFTVPERNTRLLALEGNFLLNRLLWLGLSFSMLLIGYLKFAFRESGPGKIKKQPANENLVPEASLYQPVEINANTAVFRLKSILSLVRMDLTVVVKSMSFGLLLLFWTALLVFEITNEIDGGVRMAAHYATTALMFSKIVETLPFIGSLVLLFFSNELLWKSKNVNFLALATSNPVKDSSLYLAKCVSLTLIGGLLILLSIGVGIGLQVIYGFPVFEFSLYASLFYYVGLPFLLLIVLILFLQNVCVNKYLALAFSAAVVLLLNSKLGIALGISHPLLRYANTIDLPYFEMNGFGNYAFAFHWQMFRNSAMALVLFLLTVSRWNRNLENGFLPRLKKLHFRRRNKVLLGFGLVLMISVSAYIGYQASKGKPDLSGEALFDWRQTYEEKYKRFEKLKQPEIVAVKTEVDLFPSGHTYRVKGTYTLVNKSHKSLDSVLLYFDPEIRVAALQIGNAALTVADDLFRHSLYRLRKPLQPNDTLLMHFRFSSSWFPFQAHDPANAILENGSFIRMSRFFPRLGYQPENEIDNAAIRKERRMPAPDLLKAATSPEIDPYQFIHLDAIVSTEAGQTALGSGELIGAWKTKNRSYFHYRTDRPIPFRFAFSSARYLVKKDAYKRIGIEVYYDARHAQHVKHLIANAKATLAYGETNFGPYPHRSIRFAEISSFATGFAATAYPSIIYAKENQGFHADLRQPAEQDIINQLAGHELAHLWWGAAQVNPDVREGHNLMTETLAQYTELMLYRKAHGPEKSLSLVKTHLDLYLSGRGYQPEMPLYKVDFESPHLAYNKGMVAMYQLEQLIGEARVNKALRLFFKDHAFPKPAPSSSDLIRCFNNVSPATAHAKIDELFCQIVTCDAKLEKAGFIELAGNRSEISFSGKVQKLRTDEKGRRHKIIADPQIEVGVETSGGKQVVVTFPVRNGTVSGKIAVPGKPVRVVLDPHLKNMEAFIKDNAVSI